MADELKEAVGFGKGAISSDNQNTISDITRGFLGGRQSSHDMVRLVKIP